MRRSLLAAIAVLLVALVTARPAVAHVAEVTTTVPLDDVKDAESLRRTIGAAVDKARAETIAFQPSVVTITGLRVLGDRVLIGLLFADDDGQAMLEGLLGSDEGDPGGNDEPSVEDARPPDLRI